jgi:hypothetical protein
MMICVAPPAIAGERAIGEDRMISVVEHDLIFRRGVQRRINREALFCVRHADRRHVFCSSHQQPRDFYIAEGALRRFGFRRARTHDDRCPNSWIGQFGAAHKERLPGYRLGRNRAERMAGHPDPRQIHSVRERTALFQASS